MFNTALCIIKSVAVFIPDPINRDWVYSGNELIISEMTQYEKYLPYPQFCVSSGAKRFAHGRDALFAHALRFVC